MGGHGSLESNLGDFCVSHHCRAVPRAISRACILRATTQPGHKGHQSLAAGTIPQMELLEEPSCSTEDVIKPLCS